MNQLFLPINLILIACVITMIVLSFVIYRHSKGEISSRLFFFCILSAIVWVLTNLFANIAILKGDTSYSIIWTKLTLIGPTFLPLILILFANSFPENKISLNKVHIWALSIITLSVLLFIPTKYNIESVTIINPSQMKSSFVPGPLLIIFMIYLIFGIFTTTYILVKKYLIAEEIGKLQIKNILIGLIVSLMIGLLTSLILPLFGNSNFINIAPASTIFLIIFTSYAIIKYQLLDVKLIVAETVTYLVLIVLLIELLFSSSLAEGLLRLFFLLVMGYGGSVLISSMHNEIKQKEQSQKLSQQLAEANQHLKELDHMKSEFVSLASHELLTPVSAIEGYLSMILDEKLATVDDPKAAQYLDRIYRSARRLARLIADMLNVSRIEENRLLVEKTDVDLSTLIKHVIEEIKFKAEEKKQKIIFNNPDGWKTYGDPDKIKEILINLLGNSIKYSKNPGEIHIEISEVLSSVVNDRWNQIENEMKNKPLDDQEAIKSIVNSDYRQIIGEKQLLISIKDHGIGIPKEELPKLFKKFHRVGDYTKVESQGTGLGLYISRALVELHHGRIWADSEGENKGATLTFSLPKLTDKEKIIEHEKIHPQQKEQLKPLARPMSSKHDNEL